MWYENINIIWSLTGMNEARALQQRSSLDTTRAQDSPSRQNRGLLLLPVLGNLKSPLKLQMRHLVVVDKLAHRIVLAPHHHTGGGLLRRKSLGMHRSVGGVGWIRADHLLILADRDALSLDLLDVLEAGEDFVLDDESGDHLVGGAFFDDKGLVFEGLNGAGGGDVDDDVGAAVDFLWMVLERAWEVGGERAYQRERLDDAASGVVGI